MKPLKYLHFTSQEDAEKIVASGTLWKSGIVKDAIFAVAVGGANVPGVQQTSLGRAKGGRMVAVLFEADDLPDVVFPEEVIWHLDGLKIKNSQVIPTAEAEKMLTDRIPTKENGWLDIPTHPSKLDQRTLERIRLAPDSQKRRAAMFEIAANQMHKERLRKLCGHRR